MMRACLLILLALSLGCGRGPTLAKVGGESITEADLQVLAEVNPRLKPRLETPAGKQKILETFVEQTLLHREAMRRALHRSDRVKKKLELYKKIIIAQATLDDEMDKKVKEYFDNHKDEFERVKLSHILIRTVAAEDPKAKGKKPAARRGDAEAQKLIARVEDRIKKGEDFGKLASEVSEDDRTKKSDGSLGYVTIRDKRLERWGWLPVAEKAFAMNEGEVSPPIKSAEGYHLVKVVEGKRLQPLEEADAGIRFRIQQEVRTKLLDDLKKKYKVKYVQAEKKEAAPATPPATGTTPEAPTPPAEAPPAP